MNDNLVGINEYIEVKNTDDIVSIIDLSQKQAYQAVNTAIVYRN